MKPLQDHIKHEMDALIKLLKESKNAKDREHVVEMMRNTKGRLIALTEAYGSMNNNRD